MPGSPLTVTVRTVGPLSTVAGWVSVVVTWNGTVTVGLAVLAPVMVTSGPLVLDQAYDVALVEPLASRVAVAPLRRPTWAAATVALGSAAGVVPVPGVTVPPVLVEVSPPGVGSTVPVGGTVGSGVVAAPSVTRTSWVALALPWVTVTDAGGAVIG